jgi:Trk-type K+ transport system membrane component
LDAFRYDIFQVVAIMTTTGYTTHSIFPWPEFSKSILLFLIGRLEIFPALALMISLISLGARRREVPGAQG